MFVFLSHSLLNHTQKWNAMRNRSLNLVTNAHDRNWNAKSISSPIKPYFSRLSPTVVWLISSVTTWRYESHFPFHNDHQFASLNRRRASKLYIYLDYRVLTLQKLWIALRRWRRDLKKVINDLYYSLDAKVVSKIFVLIEFNLTKILNVY